MSKKFSGFRNYYTLNVPDQQIEMMKIIELIVFINSINRNSFFKKTVVFQHFHRSCIIFKNSGKNPVQIQVVYGIVYEFFR